MIKLRTVTFLSLCYLIITTVCLGQKPDSAKTKTDSTRRNYVARMQAFAKAEAAESLEES